MQQIAQSPAWSAAECRDSALAARTVSAIADLLPPVLAASAEKLAPAQSADIVKIVTPVLILCGAVGMSADDRTEWFQAAAGALHGVPADLLAKAVQSVSAKVDHPSKIVPAIMTHVADEWARRKARHAKLMFLANVPPALPAPEPWEPKPGETAEILAEVGIKTTNGQRAHRMPTVEDYVAMGVGLKDAKKIVAKQADDAKAQTIGSQIAA